MKTTIQALPALSAIILTLGLPLGSHAAPGDFKSKFTSPHGLSNVKGMASTASGNILIADDNLDRVQVFNSAGVFQSFIGAQGAGNGQFGSPEGVAVAPNGNIVVIDDTNDRVQIFNSSGVYQSQFGANGSGNGQFNGPNGICVAPNGNIVTVDDSTPDNFQIFNGSGTFIQRVSEAPIPPPPSGGYSLDGRTINYEINLSVGNPVTGGNVPISGSFVVGAGVEVSTNVNLTFTSSGFAQTTSGTFKIDVIPPNRVSMSFSGTQQGVGYQAKLTGLNWNNPGGGVLGTANIANTVQSGVSGPLTPSFTTDSITWGVNGFGFQPGVNIGQALDLVVGPAPVFTIEDPEDCAVAPNGDIYVLERNRGIIQVFDGTTGAYKFRFGSEGSGAAQLDSPEELIAAPNGDILVADTFNGRIQVYDGSGNHLMSFGTADDDGMAPFADGSFWYQRGLCLLPNGDVACVDKDRGDVQIFEGKPVWATGPSDTTPPTLLSFERQTPATSPTNANTLVFRATFDEDVQNVGTTDFAANGTTATVSNVSTVNASTYDITVSGGDLAGYNGTVGLDLAGGQNIQDLAGNALPAGEPATDQTYALDNAPPTLVIGGPTPALTSVSPVTFTVTYAGATTVNLTTGNITLNTTGTATGTVGVTNGNTANPTVTISGVSGAGTLGITIAAGTSTDAVGNADAGAGPSATSTVIIDTTPPVIAAPFKVVETAAASAMSATVNFPANAVDDVDGVVPVICSAASGSLFPLGTTSVTCTATDAAGNSTTHTVLVIVKANAADAFKVANTGDTPTGSPGPLTGLKGGFLAGNSQILVEGAIGTSPSLSGLFTGSKSGPLTQVALAGSSPVGTTGVIAGFDRWFINSMGSVAYRARLTGTGITTANDRGHWLNGAAVAVEGGTDPDTGGTFFEFPAQGQALTDSGYYYHARLLIGSGGVTKDDNSGIYSAGSGLLLRQGDAAPGAGAGVRHTRFSNQIGANDNGDVVFSSNLGGTGISGGINNIGLFSGPPATASLVAQRGEVVPGLTGSPEIDRIFDEAINAAGETAFSVTMKNGTVTTADNSALLTDVGGTLQAIVREGDAALGFGGATEVYDEFDDVFICADGAIYFKAVVRGGTPELTANGDEAIYVWRPGGAGLCLIAKEGSGAPGLPATDVIALPALTAHRAGNAAFSALLRRNVGGVTRNNNEGVWSVLMGACAADLVLRGGDTIDVGGTMETVKRPSIAETPDDGTGGRSSSAGGGNLAITVTYQNGRQTGVFVIGQP